MSDEKTRANRRRNYAWAVVTPRGEIIACATRKHARLRRLVWDAKRNPGEERSRVAKLVEAE